MNLERLLPWCALALSSPWLIRSDLRFRRLPNFLLLPLLGLSLVSHTLELCGLHLNPGAASPRGPTPSTTPAEAVSSADRAAQCGGLWGCVLAGALGVLLAAAGAWGMGDVKLAAVLGLNLAYEGPWRLPVLYLVAAIGGLATAALSRWVVPRGSPGGDPRGPPSRLPRSAAVGALPPEGAAAAALSIPLGPGLLLGALIAAVLPL